MASADGRPSESLKRSRVTFAESSTAGVGSGAGAGDGEPSRKRRAAEQHNDTSSTGAGTAGRIRQGAYDEFDDDDQADGGMRYAEVEQEEASDNDSGNELEDAPGDASVTKSTAFPEKQRKEKVRKESDDESGDGKFRARKITRVKGEVAALDEEFDEAGVAFEPFNLKAERSEGYFDESGEYVRKKKGDEEPDAWLDDLDAMNPRERRALQEQARKVHRGDAAGVGAGSKGAEDEEEEEEDGKESDTGDEGGVGQTVEADNTPAGLARARAKLLEACVRLLKEGETVASALRRYGGQGGHTRDMASFNTLTEAADGLVDSEGLSEVYTMDRRALKMELADALGDAELPEEEQAAILRGASSAVAGTGAGAGAASSEGGGGLTTAQPTAGAMPRLPAGKMWEYTWPAGSSAAAGSGVGQAGLFGPFDSEGMNAWMVAGYFSVAQPLVREVGQGTDFRPLVDMLLV